MFRFRLDIEYDGRGFCGWQRQTSCIPTVQATIEDAIEKFCGHPVTIVGAGRTDTGVHAMAQVAHVDLPEQEDGFRISQALNFYLRDRGVSILKAEPVPSTFHARFSALKRTYIYRIINRRAPLTFDRGRAWDITAPLDVPAMQHAAQYFLGKHDFSSFRAVSCQSTMPIKTITHSAIKCHDHTIHYEVSARSFLHHQVRVMVGTLVYVGLGKCAPDSIIATLEAGNRAAAGMTAPPHGLYLAHVAYSLEDPT